MGPQQRRLGNRIVYRRAEVRTWMAERRREAICPAVITRRHFTDAQIDALVAAQAH